MQRIVSLSCGSNHTLALSDRGQVVYLFDHENERRDHSAFRSYLGVKASLANSVLAQRRICLFLNSFITLECNERLASVLADSIRGKSDTCLSFFNMDIVFPALSWKTALF